MDSHRLPSPCGPCEMMQAVRARVHESRKTKRKPSHAKKSYSKRGRKEQPANQKSIVEARSNDQLLKVWSEKSAVDDILANVTVAERKHLGLRPGTLCHVYKEAIIHLEEALGGAYLSWRCYRNIRIKEFRLLCDFMELSDSLACHEALREDGIRVDELISAIPPINFAKEALVMTTLSKAPHIPTGAPDVSLVLDSHWQVSPVMNIPGMGWSSLPEQEQKLLALQLPEDAVRLQSMVDTLLLPLQLPEDAVPLQLPEDSVPLQILQDPVALTMHLPANAADAHDLTADEAARDEIDDFGRIW